MTRASLAWGAGLVIVLAGIASGRQEKKPGSARDEVFALVRHVERSGDATLRAANLAGDHQLVDVMHTLRSKFANGVGVGEDGDSVEVALKALARRDLDASALKKQKPDLLRLAALGVTAAEVSAHYKPARPTPGLGERQWKGYVDDLKRASRALESAAVKADPARVKAAAIGMRNACNNCHGDFDKAAPLVRSAPPGLSKDVLDLADLIGGGKAKAKDIADKAGDVRKKYTLHDVMGAFKPRNKRGVAYGKTGTGIEAKIAALDRRRLTTEAIAKEKDDLARLANVSLAVAELAALYPPPWRAPGKGPDGWKGHLAEMKKAAQALKKAAAAGQVVSLQRAATSLNTTCNGCHKDFRDK